MRWPEMEFEELYAIPSRNGLTRPASVRGRGYKMINMGELFAHDRIGNVGMELVHLNEKELSTMLVETGDLLFARQSLVLSGAGKCSLVSKAEDPTTFESHIIRVRLKKDIANPYFYHYYFKSPVCRIRSIVIQGVQAGIRGNDLKKLKVHLPPISEQSRIASILSAYDDLIENNRRRIQLLEQAARLLYKEWFVHLRFPGHEHVKIKDGIPEGWRKAPLKEVCTRITDGSHSSPTSVDEGIPMASVKDMHDWGFNTDQCRKISIQDFEALVRNDCKPLKNDVLIAKDGSYLKHTFVVQEEIDLVILSSIAILRPNHLIDPHLLNFILRDPITKTRMTGYVSGVAIPRIILREFRNFEILLPSIEVQRIWAAHINPIAVQCFQLEKQNKVLAKARDMLLPRLMNGEVLV